MNFKPKIIKYEHGKEISWFGKLWISGLFDGKHSLIVKQIDDNKVLFIQKEEFKGLLVPLLSGLLKNTEKGFELMNRSLKTEAEKK